MEIIELKYNKWIELRLIEMKSMDNIESWYWRSLDITSLNLLIV